jgi:ornithine cyclodeaminase/alanine dehydrogenase-like protein (mu-crystallin family)
MLHLDDDTIAHLLDPASVTEAVADAFGAWGRGEASTTQRVRSAACGLMSSAMAAVVPPFSGGKLYATTNGVFTFVIVLFDADGRFLCTLDGDVVTRLRTPAASALAIRALAAPDSTTAALVGSGRQAWSHLQMLAIELPGLERVAVAARRAGAADELVGQALAAGIPAVRVDDPGAAVTGADVVVTVTASTEPLFRAGDIGDRTLLCAVGATKYDRREIDGETVARCAAVVCDDATGSRSECGDLIEAVAEGKFSWDRAIELHDVLAGNLEVPRAGAAPVLFETQGVALQDVAVAALAYQRYTSHYPTPVPGRNQQ